MRQFVRNQTTKVSYGTQRLNQGLGDPQPFTQLIMAEQVPPHYMIPKMVPFSGLGDPECHLKYFRAQMSILRGSDVIRCKMCIGTFTGIDVQWFNGILDGTIDLFNTFSQYFYNSLCKKGQTTKASRIV